MFETLDSESSEKSSATPRGTTVTSLRSTGVCLGAYQVRGSAGLPVGRPGEHDTRNQVRPLTIAKGCALEILGRSPCNNVTLARLRPKSERWILRLARLDT